jgi:integrase/recombinase XerD
MAVKLRRGSVRKHSIYKCYDEWLAVCRDKGLSSASIQTYKEQADLFLQYSGDIPIEQLTEAGVYDFRYWLKQNRHYNEVSTNTVFRTINIFLLFLNEEYGIDKFHLDYVKTTKKIKPIFSSDDIKKLLKQPNFDNCAYSELRDWVIINIVLNTGVRAGSIVNVKIEDINFREHTIVFRHMKNRQQQVFPLKKDVLKIIKLYLDYVEDELDEYMFINSEHKQLTSKQLSVSFQRYCKNRGIKITSFHAMRHWFATNLLRETKNIYLVSKTLGHSSVAVTERYVSTLGINEYSATLKDIDLTRGLKG